MTSPARRPVAPVPRRRGLGDRQVHSHGRRSVIHVVILWRYDSTIGGQLANGYRETSSKAPGNCIVTPGQDDYINFVGEMAVVGVLKIPKLGESLSQWTDRLPPPSRKNRVVEYPLLAFLDNRLALSRPGLEPRLWKPEE